VQIGVRALDHTQIVSGIKAGDAVITSGGLRAAGKHGDQDRSARACGKYCRQERQSR